MNDKIDNFGFKVRIGYERIALMLLYVIGIGVFLYGSEWEKAALLLCVVYWTNVAWFHEGKGRRLFILLQEAKEIMERSIDEAKEPVSEEGKA